MPIRALARALATVLAVSTSAFAFSTPAFTQSFLGTIRGTVVDPQGQAVQGASVLVIDDATGVPRTLETDAEGRYEASNLRPGTYRVQVVTTNFKKFERTGVLVGAAGTALVNVTLELGGLNEVVTVAGESRNNITLESQAIVRGLDEQQLHDLPRNSSDIQSFLLLNPNVVGGADDIQFLGAKTYGVSYIQDGQASTNAIFGTIGNSAPGLDAISEITVLSNSYSAEYGGLAGVVVTTKRGSSTYRGTGFYDFNSDSLNALTYNQTLAGVQRGDPLADTHEQRWGGSIGGPARRQQDVLLCELRRLEQQGDLRWWPSDRSDRSDAQRRLPRHRDRASRPHHRAALPRSGHSQRSHRSGGAGSHELLLSAAQSGNDGERLRRLPAVRAPDARPPARRHPTRLRADEATTRCSPAAAISTAIRTTSPSRLATRFTNLPMLKTDAQHRVGHRRLDEDHRADDRQRVPRRLQLRQLGAGKHVPGVGRHRAARHRERAEPRRRPAGLPVVPVHGGNEPADQHRRCRPQRRSHAPAERILDQRQHHVDQGRPHAQGRRPLDPQHRSRRVRLRRQFPRSVSVPRRLHRQRVHRFPPRDAFRRPRSGHEPWTARGPLQRHRALRPGRLAGQPEADAVSGPALRGRRRMARERPDARQLPARRWRLSRRGQRDGRGAAATWPAGARSHADGRRGRPARNADQHRQEQLQPARGLRLAPRREQQDGAAWRLRAVPPDRRGAGHPRPARDQRVPLRQHDNRRRPAQRLLGRHADSRPCRVR